MCVGLVQRLEARRSTADRSVASRVALWDGVGQVSRPRAGHPASGSGFKTWSEAER